MKKIVITGAAGNTGKIILSSILEHNVKITAIARSPEKIEVQSEKLTVVEADLRNPSSYSKHLKGNESAFLLTSGTSEMDKLQMDFIDECSKNGVSFILKQSAMGAIANSPVEMFQKHYEIEEKLKNSGLDYCIIRPNSFTQNLLAHSNSVKEQNTIYAPLAGGKVSYIDIRDIADVAISILLNPQSHKSRTYILTGPNAVSMREIADELSELLKQEIKYIPVSYDQGREVMLGFGMDEWLVNNLIAITKIGAENRAKQITADVNEITEKQARSVAESLSDHQFMFK